MSQAVGGSQAPPEIVNPHDAVRYPGDPFRQTRPDRLASVAALFGMRPASVASCRVLELGCGIGGNLMPMAARWPGSTFVGIDLSGNSIAHARATCSALGLANVTFVHGDIMDVTPELGTFDYIVAHGVYSWVPPGVRSKVLQICRDNLAPEGVAYVSFNAYPGCHKRNITRDIMRYHVRGAADPDAQVRGAREIAGLLANLAPSNVYREVLREQAGWIAATPDGPLYHDDLSEFATPFLFHDVVEAAAQHGLQYLSEATVGHSSRGILPAYVDRWLSQIPDSEYLLREQYLDFLGGRTFRESVFCRADVAVKREIDPQALRRFHLCAQASARAPQGGALATALRCLDEAWPRALAFADLATAVVRDADGREAGEELARLLYDAFRADLVELYVEPPLLGPSRSGRPEASLLARRQAEAGNAVTNLRHETVRLEAGLRAFLTLLDGSRRVDELAAAAALADPRMGSRDEVERALDALARRALLL